MVKLYLVLKGTYVEGLLTVSEWSHVPGITFVFWIKRSGTVHWAPGRPSCPVSVQKQFNCSCPQKTRLLETVQEYVSTASKKWLYVCKREIELQQWRICDRSWWQPVISVQIMLDERRHDLLIAKDLLTKADDHLAKGSQDYRVKHPKHLSWSQISCRQTKCSSSGNL